MTDCKFANEAQVIDFARCHSGVFDPAERLQVEEIGDGNINFVYRVFADDGNSVIIKQALPYVRIIGEGWPLSQDRIRIEAEALMLEGEYCPDLVPQVYHFDAERCAIIMEDIGALENLRHALVARAELPKLASHLGRFCAETLFHTSDLYLDAHRKKEMVARFINPDLCKITEDLFFWDPYCDHERNNINPELRDEAEGLWHDEPLKLEVARLKQRFLTSAEALLHGDLHSGSVFVDAGATRVIDAEFAFFGPIAFDVGSMIGNLLLDYAGQTELAGEAAERDAYRDWLLDAVREFWNTFAQRFGDLMSSSTADPTLKLPAYRETYLAELLSQSLGFAGTELIRRTVGLAPVLDLEAIEDPRARARAEALALRIGRTLILERDRLNGIDAAIERIRQI
ncbi:methylthioribose kinase [Marinobacterium nitratireducens]|uniref:S-methyl-5-thioribose kinase n=1 Tax=Marinobacterium nitratireducens TaxID=518897 RepID=A0A918DRM9_9GAMM|nr:S-methyl-5-thioribose kinase [Marinobacterium nitratireducens]GGO79661.1 methylthioribose kinase [Marinobacterium nitratireducens]